VEDAKIALTDTDEVRLDFHGEEVDLTPAIARADLAAAIAHGVDRIEDKLREVVAIAGLVPDRIDTLILTGGSTRIPMLLERIQRNFPAARVVETDAFGSVGLGLAIDAVRKFG
jgi:hypothetical chaperone protein